MIDFVCYHADMAKPHPSVRPFRLNFRLLRQRRRELELTQRQLAAAAGMHKQTVWRIETGRSCPSIEELVGIARALGTPMHRLFEVEDAA